MHFLSHIGQDSWAVHVLKFKQCGYFLDFGGFEGLMHSNTFYMEKYLGWRGILVEPNPVPYRSACAVRNCITINAALYRESRLAVEFTDSHGLSSLIEYQDRDTSSETRKQISAGILRVDTINPTELLGRFNAPELIDYMSLDVEGGEYEVLSCIDFSRYRIALMSVEHNHNSEKQVNIRKYLAAYGYDAIEHRNDDFFYNIKVLQELAGGNYLDPKEAQERVINNYKIIEY